MRKFKVNDFIMLKLEKDETIIYIGGERFKQCKFLLLEIPIAEMESLDTLKSIDEVAERLDKSLEPRGGHKDAIPPKVEFWGHCSNLQVWYEYGYNTRLLHRNLAFPLLKRLTEVGDHAARRIFKEEIGKRFSSNYGSVVEFLLEGDYLFYLDKGELEVLSSLLSVETKERIVNFMKKRLQEKQADVDRQNMIYDHLKVLCDEEGLKQIEFVEYEGTKYFVINGYLGISGVKNISDIQGLSSLVSLEGLYLNRNSDFKEYQIKEIEGLEHLKNLKILDLIINQISEIKGLDKLVNLEILKLDSNNISEIKGLENLKILKELHLSNNQIIEMKGLENLTNLEILRISRNKISEIKGLENNLKLNLLDLSRNQIREIKCLGKLSELEKLYLDYNQIEKIGGLDFLKNLKILSSSKNWIRKIEWLENLENLKSLDLGQNKIYKIEGLSKLKKLIEIELEHNYITEIEELEGLYDLEYLGLRENRLPDPLDNRKYGGEELDGFIWK